MKIAFCKAEDIDGRKEVFYMLQFFYITCQYKPRNIRLFIATYTGIRQKQNSLKKYKKNRQ